MFLECEKEVAIPVDELKGEESLNIVVYHL